ncbi:MAG: flippase-like domain-containing protein [Chloroflexi bacterium]|nr:flippase-like domain-containing protein [Chloroflexota bacterium]
MTATPLQGGSRPHVPVMRLARLAVLVLLFGGLAFALVGGWNEIAQYRWQLEPGSAAIALVIMVFASVWANVCWWLVARGFGGAIRLGSALRVYSSSNLGKYLPGKVLHAVARVYLAQQAGLSLALATTVVVVDVVLYLAASMLVAVLAIPTLADALTAYLPSVDRTALSGLALVGVIGALVVLHPATLNRLFALMRRLMPGRDLPTIQASYLTILRLLVCYVILWGLMALSLLWSVRAIAAIEATTLPVLAAAYALSYLGGTIMPIAPAGIGVREGLLAALLAQVVPLPAAAAVAVLARVIQVVAEGLCAAAFSRLR